MLWGEIFVVIGVRMEYSNVMRARHKKGCNTLYLDWHVGWAAAEDMTAKMWSFER